MRNSRSDQPDLLLIGPVAPPPGGIASHIERLALLLDRCGVSVEILNHFSGTDNEFVHTALRRNPLRYWWILRRSEPRICHYHHSRWTTLIAASLAQRRSAAVSVVTFHGNQVNALLTHTFPPVRWLTGRAIRHFDHVIAVSDAVATAIHRGAGRRAIVVPAYIPSPQGPSQLSGHNVSPTVIFCADGRATTPASDTYGLDVAFAVLSQTIELFPLLSVKVFIPSTPTAGFQRYVAQQLALGGGKLAARVELAVAQDLAAALVPGCIFLRPTRADGDSVSIREARAAGVPVLASNRAARPSGVPSLSLDDTADWVGRLTSYLREMGSGTLTQPLASRSETLPILDFYRDLFAAVGAAPPPDSAV